MFAGDEIGMEAVPIPSEAVQDPFEKLAPGYGLNRDPERSPMRWDESQHGGFTCGEPWLPTGRDIKDRNVATLRENPHSLLSLYRALIELRKREAALVGGDYVPMRAIHDVLMFKRCNAEIEIAVALNLSPDPRKLSLTSPARLLLSTHLDRGPERLSNGPILRGNEGVTLRLHR